MAKSKDILKELKKRGKERLVGVDAVRNFGVVLPPGVATKDVEKVTIEFQPNSSPKVTIVYNQDKIRKMPQDYYALFPASEVEEVAEELDSKPVEGMK